MFKRNFTYGISLEKKYFSQQRPAELFLPSPLTRTLQLYLAKQLSWTKQKGFRKWFKACFVWFITVTPSLAHSLFPVLSFSVPQQPWYQHPHIVKTPLCPSFSLHSLPSLLRSSPQLGFFSYLFSSNLLLRFTSRLGAHQVGVLSEKSHKNFFFLYLAINWSFDNFLPSNLPEEVKHHVVLW